MQPKEKEYKEARVSGCWRGFVFGCLYGLAFSSPLPWPAVSFLVRIGLGMWGLGGYARLQARTASSFVIWCQGSLFGMGLTVTSLWGSYSAFVVAHQLVFFLPCLLALGSMWGFLLGTLSWLRHKSLIICCGGTQETEISSFPFAFALSWCLFDFARSWIPLPFPWNLTTHLFAFEDTALATDSLQIVRPLGVFFWSFWGSLSAASWSLPHFKIWRRASLLGTLGIWFWGAQQTLVYSQIVPTTPVLVVQPNISQAFKLDRNNADKVLDRLLQQTKDAWDKAAVKPALIVWPETAVTHFLIHDLPPQLQKPQPWGDTPLAFGIDRFEPQVSPPIWRNSFVVEKNGQFLTLYDKERPLPFGEYLPCRRWIPLKWQKVLGGLDCTPGQDQGDLHLPDLPPVAVKICSEGMFSRRHQKAPWTLQVLNDAWFHKTLLWQHLAVDRARAVEARRPLLRVGNSGITALIDDRGRTLRQLPCCQEQAQVFELPW